MHARQVNAIIVQRSKALLLCCQAVNGLGNFLVFDLIGTTALFTAAIGDADAAQKWSHACLLQVMTPDD